MISELESLVSNFESGSLSRRDFVRGILLVTAVGKVASPAPKAVSLNHVTLAVSDVMASQSFYERVLGVKEVSRQSNGVNLALGESFLGLYETEPAGRIDHFCVGVENFDIPVLADELSGLGVEPMIRQDRPELYFSDPDGIRVQFSGRDYRG